MTDYAQSILDALETALGNDAVIDALDCEIVNEMPEVGTLRTNTIYMIRNGPELDEILLGDTDIYSVTCVSSYFFKPSTKKYIAGYSTGLTDLLEGERLLSVVFGAMNNVLKDISVSGLNIAGHGIETTNQSNASESSMPFYLAEVVTKTLYEA